MRARRAAADYEKRAELAQRSWELLWKAGASRGGAQSKWLRPFRLLRELGPLERPYGALFANP